MDEVNRTSLDIGGKDESISADEIIEKIRQEYSRGQSRTENNHKAIDSDGSSSFHLPEKLGSSDFRLPLLSLYPTFSRKANGDYHIRDLLNFHHEEFVENAYMAILGRNADPIGLDIFLKRLNRGMSKIEILGRMRYSPEGRKKKIKVQGLVVPLTAHMIFKIPIIGYLCRLGISFIRLPKALRDRIDFEHSSLYRNKNLQTLLNQNTEAIENEFNKISGSIAEQGNNYNMLIGKLNDITENFSVKLNRHNDRMDGLKETLAALDVQSQNRINELNDSINQWVEMLKQIELKKAGKDETHQLQDEIKEILRQIHDHKLNIMDQHRRLRLLLEEARKRLPKPISKAQIKEMVKEEDHLLDVMYLAFEDKLRGTREDIKNRAKVYVPCVKKTGAGKPESPILDVGCGRGEWLELCNDEQLAAIGVDINRVTNAQCHELGLNIIEEDVISFLRKQKSTAYGAITGIHIIEHLPLKKRIILFEEALRILPSGGIIIIETPNPESLLVSSSNFYIDPTHISPIPPESLQFLAAEIGFVNIEIIRLHKRKEPKYTGDEFLDELIYRFNMEQDYALIGYKA